MVSDDKMPALPEICAGIGDYDADQMHAYARAYAAEQTRELVEALESVTEILDMALMVGIPTLPPDADGPAVSARALIAKHKGQATC